MDPSRKSNKIRDIVRLQQILKKWKKVANSNKSTTTASTTTSAAAAPASGGGSKSIKFLKKTLSFTESTSSSTSSQMAAPVPKGYIAVCVGRELKRFVIPTEYLSHQVFGVLLSEAEEEFGFQQEGVLKFPCEVDLFEKILRMMEDKRSDDEVDLLLLQEVAGDFCDVSSHKEFVVAARGGANNCSPDSGSSDLTPSHHHHPQMCR